MKHRHFDYMTEEEKFNSVIQHQFPSLEFVYESSPRVDWHYVHNMKETLL